MSGLSAGDKRRITKDWSGEFPELEVWKPLRLLRRLGPIVQGVTLAKSSGGDYLPTAHVHTLVRPFPTISLMLAQPLSTSGGVQDRIRLRRHDEVYVAAAERLREQCSLSLDEPPTLDDLVAAYRKAILNGRRPRWPTSVNEIEDLVLVPAVLERTGLVQSGLELARLVSADWPAGSLERWRRDDNWLEELERSACEPETLRSVVDAEVDAHGLGDLAVGSLTEA